MHDERFLLYNFPVRTKKRKKCTWLLLFSFIGQENAMNVFNFLVRKKSFLRFSSFSFSLVVAVTEREREINGKRKEQCGYQKKGLPTHLPCPPTHTITFTYISYIYMAKITGYYIYLCVFLLSFSRSVSLVWPNECFILTRIFG